MFKHAVPILGASSSVAAEAFYCGKLGFERVYAYRPAPDQRNTCWMGLSRDGAHFVIPSFRNIPAGKQSVQIYVEDVASLH